MSSILDRILVAVEGGEAQQQAVNNVLIAAAQSISAKLDQILSILLEPATITGAELTLQGVNGMKAMTHKTGAKAKVDFVLQDNGTATGTISFVDSVGEPTVTQTGATVATNPVSSDPGVVVSVDATGLVLTIAPASPVPNPLPVGVTITATVIITNPDASTITLTAVSDPIDVVAGGPAGASISLQ